MNLEKIVYEKFSIAVDNFPNNITILPYGVLYPNKEPKDLYEIHIRLGTKKFHQWKVDESKVSSMDMYYDAENYQLGLLDISIAPYLRNNKLFKRLWNSMENLAVELNCESLHVKYVVNDRLAKILHKWGYERGPSRSARNFVKALR
jgi:hypothetical protein